MQPLKVLDLFSGIGGFSLGLQMAGGFETVQFVEIDPWARRVLAKNFPGISIHDDIKTFHGTSGSADVICGGFPCQPFSVAGKQRGTADDRDLWPEMRRVVGEVRPTWVVGENVVGFVKMELDRSLADLEDLGYACIPFVLPACAVAAPHRRERVWIVAHANEQGSQGHGGLRERASERLAGPDGWAEPATWFPEPDVGRVANGIPRRVDRLRGLGNAVVPQVVAEIGRAIRLAAVGE